MTRERFIALAEAFGADLSRWPQMEQAQAERWLSDRPEAAAILSQARVLDAALDAYVVEAPAAELQRRIVTAILTARRKRGRLAGWLSGLGALGALGAGAAAGAGAMALVSMSPPFAPWDGAGVLYEQSSFGDVASTSETPPPWKGT